MGKEPLGLEEALVLCLECFSLEPMIASELLDLKSLPVSGGLVLGAGLGNKLECIPYNLSFNRLINFRNILFEGLFGILVVLFREFDFKRWMVVDLK